MIDDRPFLGRLDDQPFKLVAGHRVVKIDDVIVAVVLERQCVQAKDAVLSCAFLGDPRIHRIDFYATSIETDRIRNPNFAAEAAADVQEAEMGTALLLDRSQRSNEFQDREARIGVIVEVAV